jgi:peroxiredoxin
VVLGVSIDDTAETLRAYAPQKKMTYPVLLMQDDVDQAYGPIYGVPVTFFIGRDGMISRKHFGPVTKEQVDQEIKALL